MVAVPGHDGGATAVMPLPRTDAVEHGEPAADQRAFRRCLGQFPTASPWSRRPGKASRSVDTANSFSSLSLDPPLVLWSIALASRSCSAFRRSEHFAVNILQRRPDRHLPALFDRGRGQVQGRRVAAWLPRLADPSGRPGIHRVRDGSGLGRRRSRHPCRSVKRYARFPGSPLLYAQGRYAVAEDHPRLLGGPAAPLGAGGKRQVQDLRPMALLAYVEMYASDAFDRYRQSEGVNLPRAGPSSRSALPVPCPWRRSSAARSCRWRPSRTRCPAW